MKQIISLGNGKFIHLDSYGESRETRRSQLMVAAFAILIAAFTVGAALGIDITSPTPQNHADTHRTHH